MYAEVMMKTGGSPLTTIEAVSATSIKWNLEKDARHKRAEGWGKAPSGKIKVRKCERQ